MKVELSVRQREVIELICRGFANKQIAVELKISSATVEHHVRLIKTRLKATTLAQAAFRWANR